MSELDSLISRLETLADDYRQLANAFVTGKVGPSAVRERLSELESRTEGLRDALVLAIARKEAGR